MALQMASSDGRTVAYVDGPRRRTVVVVRIREGRVLRHRLFRGDRVRVVALDRRRSLVRSGASTSWWDLGSGTVRAYAADAAVEADRPTGRVVLSWGRAYRYYVGSVPQGAAPSWWGPGSERPTQVSPDGRMLLSLDTGVHRGFSRLYVRAQRDGAAQRSFTGHFDDVQEPRWETATTFLVLARWPDVEAGARRLGWVRCSVAGRCETVGPSPTRGADVPPYGVRWVLAGP